MHIPLVLAAALAVTTIDMSDGLRAQAAQEPAVQEVTTPLLKTPLAGVEGKEVNVLHISVPPGFVTPRHSHPGQLFIYVVNGAVTIEVEGEPPVKLGPGDIVEEPSGTAMVGKNLSSTHGAELIVFEIGDKDAPLQVPAE